jgi:peptidoglycan/LPS O-acetylase OafA/YrhL
MFSSQNRIFSLDVARALAIVSVVLTHSIALIPNFDQENRKYIRLFFGFQGVELFFVLSGFLIGTILIKSYEKAASFDFSLVKNFWIKRWFRTLPNYYLFAFLSFALAFVKHKPLGDVQYLFFLQNFSKPMSDFFDISWSLCIEEWFYVTLPLVLWCVHRCWNISIAQKILSSILLFLVVGFLIRWYMTTHFQLLPNFDEGIRKIVLTRFDAIPYGVLAALLHHYYQSECERFKVYFKVIFVFLFLIFNILLVCFLQPEKIPLSVALWIFPLDDVLFLCFLLGFYQEKSTYQRFSQAVTYVSILSYSAYLIHPLLILAVNQLWLRWQTPILLNYLLFWFLTFFLSHFVYVFYEKPLMSYRDRFGEKS